MSPKRKAPIPFDIPVVPISETVSNPNYLGITTTKAQLANLKAIMGESLDESEVAIVLEATGRDSYDPPPGGWRDVVEVIGRRGGKSSRIACPLAIHLACVVPHPIPLTERGSIVVIAPTLRQARATFRTMHKMIMNSPLFCELVEN